MEHSKDLESLRLSHQRQLEILSNQTYIPINPPCSVLNKAESELLSRLPEQGLGIVITTNHLLETISPALNASSLSPNYYGFVTGGVTPAARVADNIVTLHDQNVQVHLPDQTLATSVENRAFELLVDLLKFDRDAWPDKIFTTGATSSNVLGLACGREYIIDHALGRHNKGLDNPSSDFVKTVGEHGLLAACRFAEIDDVQILTTLPHSSLKKASSIVGIGRASIFDVGKVDDFLAFDLQKTESMLKLPKKASIVVVSCGEVNTGGFATRSLEELQALRSLCNVYGAWIHVDGAFGIFARALERSSEFEYIWHCTNGLELVDSITGDAHKLLNVPYDCGFFFCRHPNLIQKVFRNPNAAYLNSKVTADGIKSPLNIGIENSRRFRALPVYATLMSYGRTGYQEMLYNQIRLARKVATHILEHPAFDLLPKNISSSSRIVQDIFIIILFRAKNPDLNKGLVQKINATSKINVSGTLWEGLPASRIAVSNWQANPDRDLDVIRSALEAVLNSWNKEEK